MKLIHLEEVQKILVDYCDELPRHWIRKRGDRANMGLKILNLSTIDPIATIDKMIEEKNKIRHTSRREWDIATNALIELKSRLLNNK